MPRAEYDVQKGAPSPADTSFRSCVLAILIFIFLCLIMVLIAVGLRSARSSEPRAVVAPAHRESEKVDLKGRFDKQGGDEDIETLTTTTTTTTTTQKPTSGTKHPNVTTTEHPVVTERNASSEDSRASTVAAAVASATTEAPATAPPEGQAPVTSRGEPAVHTTRNHTTTLAGAATEGATTPPADKNATTARPQPPPIVLMYSATSDVPPTYLPSSVSSIPVDHGLEVTDSEPHSATSNTTDSVDTGVSLHFTSSVTLGPRGNATETIFVVSDSSNDSTVAVNNVTATPLTAADRNETTKSFDSSTTTATPNTTNEVVTQTTNVTEADSSGLQPVFVFPSSEEQTTVVTEPSSSENGSSVTDDRLVVARNDNLPTTTATTEATDAVVNLTSEDSPTPAHVEPDEGSPTTASATWASADNSTETALYTNTTLYIAHTVTSEETSSRENATVPVTTTEAVTTVNTTTAATSENSTIAVPTLLPVDTTPAPEPRVCRTDACYRQAQRMAAMMNHTVPPCRNFYVAACGGLQTDPLLQQYDPQAEAFHRIAEVTRSSKERPAAIKKLREFEESCMQYGSHMADTESRFAEVQKVMNNIGNFSFDDGEWKNFRSKFADLFSTLIKYNSSPLFDVLLDVESKKNPTFVFKLVPPLPGGSIFSGDKRTYECWRSADQNNNETEINMDNKYFSYQTCIENYDIFSNTVQMVKELGYFKGANETAAEKFNESLTFALIDLHKYMKIPKEADVRQEQFTKNYKLAKVADLDGMFPLLDWKTLFMNLVEDHHESIGEQVVQIYSMSYFNYVFNELASSAEGEHAFAKDLNNALLAYAAQKLVEDFVEQHSFCDREAYCQYVSYNLMSQAASSAYLQSFTPVDLRRMEDRARETFTHLKNTLNDEFQNAKWLDEESKTEVFEQLRNINLAPYDWESFLLNNTYLDDYYKELNINRTNYFQNAVNLVLLNKKHSYSLYLKNPLLPQHIWSHFKYPYQYTGNVIYALNTVVIPIGLLSKFSNDASLPKYINMAGEGLVMAHELAHVFDFVGMKREFHEEDLKLSSHSASVFMDMKMCMTSEYDFKKSHAAEDGNLIVFQTTGALSANERMADYTGMLIAYSTYLKHWGDSQELLPLISNWTPNQLFFLQAAQELCSKRKIYHHFLEIFEDVHLPSAIRVENMVSNSADFSKVFNCPEKLLCEVFPRNSEPDMNYPVN